MKLKRSFALIVSVLVIAVGCSGPPTHYGPWLDVHEAPPETTSPGETFSFKVRSAPTPNGYVSGRVLTQVGADLGNMCTADMAILDDSPEVQETTLTCTVPANATNGSWWVMVRASTTTNTVVTPGVTTLNVFFTVEGGVDENGAPELMGYTLDPSHLVQNTTFALTTTLTDTSSPISLAPNVGLWPGGSNRIVFSNALFPNSRIVCSPVSTTETSPDLYDLVWSCETQSYQQPGPIDPGQYIAMTTWTDPLGHAVVYHLYAYINPGLA